MTDQSPAPAADFDVTTAVDDAAATVTVRGEVDVYTAPRLRERLYAVVGDGAQRVVLDLSDMTFIDSTGIGALVGALKRCRSAAGDVVLRGPSAATNRVLELTGLHSVFEVVDGR